MDARPNGESDFVHLEVRKTREFGLELPSNGGLTGAGWAADYYDRWNVRTHPEGYPVGFLGHSHSGERVRDNRDVAFGNTSRSIPTGFRLRKPEDSLFGHNGFLCGIQNLLNASIPTK
jgi:hypothetical protein